MSSTAETCRAQRYSDGGWRSSVMPADREQSPVHEPADDDGARHEAEEVAGGAEEDELKGCHRVRCVGRAEGADPARREWRRGGRPCTHPVYGAARVASSSGAYRCSGSRTEVVSVDRAGDRHCCLCGPTAYPRRHASHSWMPCSCRVRGRRTCLSRVTIAIQGRFRPRHE